ncbi:MAG: hypothetical protein ACXIUQ_01495 [Cecembia sp.]
MLTFMGVIPITSCVDQCDGPCGCFPVFEAEEHSITQLTIEPVFRHAQSQPFNPEMFYFYQTLYLGILASDFRQVSEKTENIAHRSGFFPSALANCSSGEIVSIETLNGLKVINRTAIQITEDIFLAEGEDITDKFVATTNFQQMVSIEDFLKRGHRFQEKVRFHIRFNQKPRSNSDLVFDVILELSNGNSFTFRSQRLKISP